MMISPEAEFGFFGGHRVIIIKRLVSVCLSVCHREICLFDHDLPGLSLIFCFFSFLGLTINFFSFLGSTPEFFSFLVFYY